MSTSDSVKEAKRLHRLQSVQIGGNTKQHDRRRDAAFGSCCGGGAVIRICVWFIRRYYTPPGDNEQDKQDAYLFWQRLVFIASFAGLYLCVCVSVFDATRRSPSHSFPW